MPTSKKKPEPDTSKRNQIDAYTYEEYDRTNIPPVGMAQYDTAASPEAKYDYDPHIDPSLQWAGKKEGTSFTVPTSSIHVHEVIKPHKIIRSVQTAEAAESQGDFFESDAERAKRRSDAIEFYQHKDKWTNRLIAGDSLVIMNSLLEKEGMAGQVQMVYIDPPYGIKYGSNFQPFVNKRDVKDKKDEDLSSEPEMIKAFRDTWELGIHSYLTYLRDRLLLAHELLSDRGSVFVQISDENVHLVRCLCDEVFGVENCVMMIPYKTTGGAMQKNAPKRINDFLIWYAKNIEEIKFHRLYKKQTIDTTIFTHVEEGDGTRRAMTEFEKQHTDQIDVGLRPYTTLPVHSMSGSDRTAREFNGKEYTIPRGSWRYSLEGFNRLIEKNRIIEMKTVIRSVSYFDDFPYEEYTSIWNDTSPELIKSYAVQTSTKVIERCLLMTTDPGDLVLDITCGSGTTAYVAEQWGRRWITCDTSRIAVTLAKKRLMTAVFPYYRIKEYGPQISQINADLISENQRNLRTNNNPSNGFVYKTVPHITLKSIANNEPPEQETLYDQPEIEKRKVRVSGPFTVEALPAPVVKPLEETTNDTNNTNNDSFVNIRAIRGSNYGKKLEDWMAELQATGILGKGGEKIQFSRVELLEGTKFLHAEGETKEKAPRRGVICFAGETRPLDKRLVMQAMDEAETIRPKPGYIVFAAFQFDPDAAKTIDDTKWPGVTLLKVLMNTDLMTGDLKKKSSSSQSFWLVGQPDVELIRVESPNNENETNNKTRNNSVTYKVVVRGFDCYDVKKGVVESGNIEKVALWMLDTDYDGMAMEPKQVFFPMEGKNEGWDKLAKTLKAEIDQDLIEKYRGVESLPFMVKENTLIAVKIVDDRGIESLKVIPVGEK